MATEENLDEIDIKILNLPQEYISPLLPPSSDRSDWSVRDTSSDMER